MHVLFQINDANVQTVQDECILGLDRFIAEVSALGEMCLCICPSKDHGLVFQWAQSLAELVGQALLSHAPYKN